MFPVTSPRVSWIVLGLIFVGCSPDSPTPTSGPTETRPSIAGKSSHVSTTTKPPRSTSQRDRRTPGSGDSTGSSSIDPVDLAVQPEDWFEDVTQTTGIDATYRNGREAGKFFILESLGGGVGMIDYDLDGDLDLVFAGGGAFEGRGPVSIRGLPSKFYQNDGDWSFKERTAAVGLAEPADYSHGFSVVDYDADGFPDLLLTCYGRSRLYRNQGDGVFFESAGPAEFPATGWGTSAGWGDLDRDGFPDLFLGKYLAWDPEHELICKNELGERDICGPAPYPATIGTFLHNDGNGSFSDWTETVGLVGGAKGLGMAVCDFDQDGWLDFYAANDETPNQLFFGGPNGRLTESGKGAGVAFNEFGTEEGSMGVGVDDFDGNGLPDIWVTNFENEDNALYRNLGGGQFKYSTVTAGVSGHSRMMVGFGTAMLDFDGDNWPDLFVCNGNAIYSPARSPYAQKPQLFRNTQKGRFENVSRTGGPYFRTDHAGRGLAVGDLDQDGAVDAVVVHQNAPATILKNRKTPANWIRIQLRATHGERDAIGSRVTLLNGERRVVRTVAQGIGYFSQSDLAIVFSLPNDLPSVDVAVEWLGRSAETFRGLSPKKVHVLVEGRGTHESE